MPHVSAKFRWLKYEKSECKIKREGREVKVHLSRRKDQWWNIVKTLLKIQIYRKQENCWVAERLLAYRGDFFSMESIMTSLKYISQGVK